jgi:hypothetical protein
MAWIRGPLVWLAATAAILAGCAVDTSVDESAVDSDVAGTMELALTWTGNRVFNTVEYLIETADGEFYREGVIDVSESDFWISTHIDGIRAGQFTLTLTAVSEDGAMTCRSGDVPFAIRPGERTDVNPVLVCSRPRNTGALQVQAQLDDCTETLESVSADATFINVGESTTLHIIYGVNFTSITWTATSGTFGTAVEGGASELLVDYLCTEVGSHTITVTVTNADPRCDPETRELIVTCGGGG